MKAVICTKYGNPEVLKIQEVDKPFPKDNEILVKIVSTAVNSGDVRVRGLEAKGLLRIIMRIIIGFTRPRKPILGTVFSGTVEQMGSNVNTFKIGDKVFGMTGFKFGTYAEYLTVDQNSHVLKMPDNASFDEAVSIIFGGQTAIYFLEKMKITEHPNCDILIIGATGSVGSSAIQIAKYFGANVTAVCSSHGKFLVDDLGVENIILYDQKESFRNLKKFDFVFDAVGKMSPKLCKKLLKKGGIYKTVGGYEVASEAQEQLQLLKTLFEKGSLKAVIDRKYSLEDIVAAHSYVGTGRKKGNVIINVDHQVHNL